MRRPFHSTHPVLGWALCVLWTVVGCAGGAPSSICGSAEDPALQYLCLLDDAVKGDGPIAQRREACLAIETSAWRDACLVQLAERQAWSGDLGSAYELCLDAGALTRACTAQVAWQGPWYRLDATPASVDAQQQVDAHVKTLPDGGVTAALRGFQGASELARAAAWHGIYAGSGSTDPTALRSASDADRPLARSAFAWEAVRLLPESLSIEEVIEAVWALASGTRPPLQSAPTSLDCVSYDVMPRMDTDFRLQPLVRAFGSWLRFSEADPEADFRVATLDALLVQRGEYMGLAGLDHPSRAVQKTIARHVALMAPAKCEQRKRSLQNKPECADLAKVWTEADTESVRHAVTTTRKALKVDLRPRFQASEGCR